MVKKVSKLKLKEHTRNLVSQMRSDPPFFVRHPTVAAALAVLGVVGLAVPLLVTFTPRTWLPHTIQLSARYSATCVAGSGLSVLISAALAISGVAQVLRRVVLPFLYKEWDTMAIDRWECGVKQRKMVAQFVALLLRLDCFLVLLTVWQSFTWEHGLVFSSIQVDNFRFTCNVDQPDSTAVRAFFLARVWLAALMIWELAFIPGLMWDDWAHHVITLLFCMCTTDNALGGGVLTPHMQAAGFSFTFGAALAFVNYFFLLGYHFATGNPRRQGILIGVSAVFSAAWQTVLFVVVPTCVMLTGYWKGDVGTRGLLFVNTASVLIWVVDAKANVVRWQMMRAKLQGPPVEPMSPQSAVSDSASESEGFPRAPTWEFTAPRREMSDIQAFERKRSFKHD